jgi:hypothetical protein
VRGLRYSGIVAACAAGLAMSVAAVRGQAPDAAQVLSAARQALGGDKKLGSIKTFTATGRTRQVRGNNLVPIEFEIACELPDKYVRTDEFPAQDADPTTVGFNGDTLIQFPQGPAGGGRAGGPPPAPGPNAGRGRGGAPGPQRLATVKQDFVRLTLGMFAASLPNFPLTFTYAAEGDAPEGKADILDVKGPANFSARLVVQRDTHLPVMLMWQQPGNPAAEAKPIESRVYYGDFREVDGVKWPFRLRRAVGGETIEETTFDRFRINARIDPRKFEAPK